jgi:hypothetical protein
MEPIMSNILTRIVCVTFFCSMSINSLAALKNRNLIILIETGTEQRSDKQAILGTFISALMEECAYILIPDTLWNCFLYSKHLNKAFKDGEPSQITAQQIFKPEHWDIYKIGIDQKQPQLLEHRTKQVDYFYLFVPRFYKEQLLISKLPSETIAELKQKPHLSNCTDEELTLGLNLQKTTKINDPFKECGELGVILKKNEDIVGFSISLKQTLGNSFLECLNQLLIFKIAHEAQNSIELPQYNVIMAGHGSTTPMSPQLKRLMAQAQKLGFWPSGNKTPSYTSSKDINDFKATQEQIPYLNIGSIAGLSSLSFGKTLEFFNGITNSFFVKTCYGGGRHLVLPFVFMKSPHLSYTLIDGALLDLPTLQTTPVVREFPNPLDITSEISFKTFFDGIDNFSSFIQKEKLTISAREPHNYFARLLNYVTQFLDMHGNIVNIENVPWIKLPGPTEWQVVTHMDQKTIVITDVMIAGKKLEQQLGPLLRKKRGLPEETVNQPPEINVVHKNLIFVATHTITIPVNFGKTESTKAIIPISKPSSYSEWNIITFDVIRTQDTLTTFFNNVLKPKEPLVQTPNNTILCINQLYCSNDTEKKLSEDDNIVLNNCIIVFGRNDMHSYDFYFSYNDVYYGAKNEMLSTTEYKSGGLHIKLEERLSPRPILLQTAMSLAQQDQNSGLLAILQLHFKNALHKQQQIKAQASWNSRSKISTQ